ncbi:hypothetical protein EDD85DRAFT_944965 [Armillaria nabsnona]|nr:hypothetical protein EDD85DRAFT_944965 [Armillaria nabsnona]
MIKVVPDSFCHSCVRPETLNLGFCDVYLGPLDDSETRSDLYSILDDLLSPESKASVTINSPSHEQDEIERAIHQKVGIDKDHFLNWLYTSVEGDLPPDHGFFYATRLPFLPITTLDSLGRPWGSILASPDSEPGFISSPKCMVLSFDIKMWDGNLFASNVRESGDKEILIAGIGVEFSTRRKHKFAGKIMKRKGHGDGYRFDIHVNEAIGNSPKYIPLRELVPYQGSPTTVFNKCHLSGSDELPDSIISFIQSCDTTFFGTTYTATEDAATRFPSHIGMNFRSGQPGFVHMRSSDKRTLVLPDSSGNRIMMSLGNIEATPLASLTLIFYMTGDILYMTG